ncbi:MAG: LicD family protein [Prolixibacteraceae bacterium]|nr:LicD family protein [Prolixibacteraceae bacterium]
MIEKIIWWLRSLTLYRFLFSGIKERYVARNFFKYGKEALRRCDKALRDNNIQYWLDFGTLLGAIRENDFIKHDNDIDIGILHADYSKNIELAMEKEGFKKIRQFEINNGKDGLEQAYSYKGVNIDFFYYLSDEKKIWTHIFDTLPNETFHSTVKKRGGLIPIRVEHKSQPLKNFTFQKISTFVPLNSENYLKEYYNNWRVPTKDWIPERDSPAVKILNNEFGTFTTFQVPFFKFKKTIKH